MPTPSKTSPMSPLNDLNSFMRNPPEQRLQMLQQLQPSERGPSELALMQLLGRRTQRERLTSAEPVPEPQSWFQYLFGAPEQQVNPFEKLGPTLNPGQHQ